MSEMDLEELIATRILNGLDDGMYENEKLKEYIKTYEDLKRNRDVIERIEPDFFFEIVGEILNDYKRCLNRENKKKHILTINERRELIDYADLMRKEERYYANLIRKAAGNFNE